MCDKATAMIPDPEPPQAHAYHGRIKQFRVAIIALAIFFILMVLMARQTTLAEHEATRQKRNLDATLTIIATDIRAAESDL